MPHRRRVAGACITGVAVVGGAALAVAALHGPGTHGAGTPTTGRGAAQLASQAASLARPAKPAFSVTTPQPLRLSRDDATWAPVIRRVLARSNPRPHAPVIASVSTRTPERTTNILLVLDMRRDRAHRLWVHVRLPILPNGTIGWVPRAALGGYRFVRTRLVINLHSLEAILYRGRRVVFHAPVGVGARGTATPVGDFYVRDRLTRYASPFYGPVAFGTSARSPVLTDWPAGGYIGIHGTNHPELIPGRISHGCIRLRNPDIRRLATLMPVGTPIAVR
jgi:L,D-transpeptidase catalytic domain